MAKRSVWKCSMGKISTCDFRHWYIVLQRWYNAHEMWVVCWSFFANSIYFAFRVQNSNCWQSISWATCRLACNLRSTIDTTYTMQSLLSLRKSVHCTGAGGASVHELHLHRHGAGTERVDGACLSEHQGVLQGAIRHWVSGINKYILMPVSLIG